MILLIGGTAAIAGMSAVALIQTLNKLHSDALQRSIQESTEFAAVLAGQTSRSVEAINIVLEEIVTRIKEGTANSEPPENVLRSPETRDYLLERLARLPHADVVSIINKSGRIVSSTRPGPAPAVDLSDRDYFRAAIEGTRNIEISAPVANRIAGKTVVYFSRHIESADGEILGVANVGLEPSHLIESHATSAHVQGRALVLFRRDGVVLSHSEVPEAAGTKIPQNLPWHNLVQAGGGDYRTRSIFDGVERLVVVKPLRDWPLVVDVSQHEKAALSTWYEIRRNAWLFTVVAATTSVFLVSALLRKNRKLAEVQQLSWKLAHEDALTSLPNRRALIDELQRILSEGCEKSGAILFVDLDRFKAVNDSLGHVFGDELLCQVAGRLTKIFRKEDVVSRIGGDEFVIFVDGADSLFVGHLAERVIKELAHPFRLSNGSLANIGASIGIRVFGNSADAADKLIDDADRALYQAKLAGRGRYHLFEPALEAVALRRLKLDARMRLALERGEFELVYQPVVALLDGQITGAEALLRWHDPEHGTIMPGDFIPLAEETGFIEPLSRWVLENAIAQMSAWRAEGLSIRALAVNLSIQQFENAGFVPEVEALLVKYSLPAGCITLELTESMAMRNQAEATLRLAQLRKLGFTIALDDFGTGYSSLSLLRLLPIDRLKVDRSFVRDMLTEPAARSVTSAVIGLAKMLDLEVVAEGIETQDHLELLRSMGCEFAQGYFLGKPMSAAAFRNRLLSALIPKSPPFAWSTGLRGTQAPAGWRAQKLNSEGFGL
jgi:diguanylate cyclase (GGDEF)-like protein